MADKRPVYLNLLQIRLPLPGLVSILHRASGVLLFLLLPLMLFLLQQSLQSESGFLQLRESISRPAFKIWLAVLLFAWLHHFLAGLRLLLLDMHIGVELPRARLSSALVLALAVVLTSGMLLW